MVNLLCLQNILTNTKSKNMTQYRHPSFVTGSALVEYNTVSILTNGMLKTINTQTLCMVLHTVLMVWESTFQWGSRQTNVGRYQKLRLWDLDGNLIVKWLAPGFHNHRRLFRTDPWLGFCLKLNWAQKWYLLSNNHGGEHSELHRFS